MTLSPQRDGRLTASLFASAIGIGYDSRQKLWRQLTGREERFQGNANTQWGSDHEKDAITAYEVATGDMVMYSGKRQQFLIHDEHDWLGCTPDGIIYKGQESLILEAKCPSSMELYGTIPDHYMPQLQGQMEISGLKKAHFVCWTPEKLEVFEVEKNQDYWQECFNLLSDFWACVQEDKEPKRQKKPKLPKVIFERIV